MCLYSVLYLKKWVVFTWSSPPESTSFYILRTKDTVFMALVFFSTKVNRPTIYNGVPLCSMHSTSTNWLRSNGLDGGDGCCGYFKKVGDDAMLQMFVCVP
jgi:hypothetical protein